MQTSRPVIEEELPVNSEPLNVTVDGIKATIVRLVPEWGSEGIAIELESEHPKLGRSFGTKYYHFIEEGIMQWGHEGEKVNILHAE